MKDPQPQSFHFCINTPSGAAVASGHATVAVHSRRSPTLLSQAAAALGVPASAHGDLDVESRPVQAIRGRRDERSSLGV